MKDYFIGVDLGGTKILTALSNEQGDILNQVYIPTEAEKGQDYVIDNIIKSIDSLLEEENIGREDIKRIGIGSPGPLNIREGLIYEAPNLNWKNVPIGRILEERTGIKVNLENDANAAALGEKYFGAGKDVDNMIYITVSTGIGGGIIIDNKLLHGVKDTAGEIGHMVIMVDGPLCGCGNRGCFEAVASGTAISKKARELAASKPDSLLYKLVEGELAKIDGKILAEAAEKGDELALKIWDEEAYHLGIGIANLLNIFNPEAIILGGGVMKSLDLFKDKMMETLKEYAFASAYNSVEIRKAALGSEVGAKGAIAVAMGG
ncbi:MAG TPA: ROK family glucokinase [Halanaerobiaceae bacterium]|nr:ROK family glucokinase [Halanaerobiaceae bacterium]